MYFGNSLYVNFFVYYGSKPGRHLARNLASLASLAGGTGGESVNSAGLSSQSQRAKTLSTDLVILNKNILATSEFITNPLVTRMKLFP